MKIIISPSAMNPDPNGAIQRYIDVQVIRECSRLVPFSTNMLMNSARVANGGGRVEYTAPYARRHYYNTGGVDVLGRKYSPAQFRGAPTRGAYWFERMKNEGGADRILRGAAALAGTRYAR